MGGEKEEGAFQEWGELPMEGLFDVAGGRWSFLVHHWGWGDGICAWCCRGWEGFLACGEEGGAGFPAWGVLSAG